MIESSLSPHLAATAAHRAAGAIDRRQAGRGAAEAPLALDRLFPERGRLNLVRDLAGTRFEDLAARHRRDELCASST